MELKRNQIDGNAYAFNLLIVPYGIETRGVQSDNRRNQAFNRTLWN